MKQALPDNFPLIESAYIVTDSWHILFPDLPPLLPSWRKKRGNKHIYSYLVGGFNPFEKYARQIGSFFSQVKGNKKHWKRPPRYHRSLTQPSIWVIGPIFVDLLLRFRSTYRHLGLAGDKRGKSIPLVEKLSGNQVSIPRRSMYGTFSYIWSKFMVNVGRYNHTLGIWDIQGGPKNYTVVSGVTRQNSCK